MASPDISPYIDLTLYDRQPAEVYQDAVEYAQIALPEFEPQVGSVESAILQGTSLMTGELIGAINRMTPGMIEVLLQLFEVSRDAGTVATGKATITVIDNSGYVIPKGTRFGYLDRSDQENPFLFAFDTDTDLTIPALSTSGQVDITGIYSEVYPSLSAGQPIQLITPTAFIQSAVLAEGLQVGSEPETDAQYFSRAIAKLNSYSAALALPSQFSQYVLETYSDVYRAQAYSRVNDFDTISGWTPANGYLTIYVSKVGGASLTAGAKTAIDAEVSEKAVAGLNILIKDANIVSVPISVSFKVATGYDSGEVKDAVELALDQYIHPDYWLWADKIYYNEVVSLIDKVPGVDRVVSLSIDGGGAGADFSFVKFGSLPVNVATVTIAA